MVEEKERLDVKGINQAFELIKNKKIKTIFDRFVLDFKAKVNFQGIYSSRKEIERDIKERVVSGLEEQYTDMKSRISHLRKKGKCVDEIDFNLLIFPLKAGFLKADFNMKNYENAKRIILSCSSALEKFKDVE